MVESKSILLEPCLLRPCFHVAGGRRWRANAVFRIPAIQAGESTSATAKVPVFFFPVLTPTMFSRRRETETGTRATTEPAEEAARTLLSGVHKGGVSKGGLCNLCVSIL